MEQGDYVAMVDDDQEYILTLKESFQTVAEDMMPIKDYTTGNQIIVNWPVLNSYPACL